MFAPRQFVRSSPAKSVSALRSLTRWPQTRPMSSSPSAAAERIEQDANRMPNNAMKQAELYSSWNRNSQPWQTIRRFETGQYAANEAATREYLTALAGVQRLDRVVPTLLQHQQELSANVNAVDSMAYGPAASTSYPGSASSMYGGPTGSMFQGNGGAAASASSTFNPFASSAAVSSGAVPFNNPTVHSSSSAKAPSGTDAEPVHVVMQEPSMKQMFFRLARILVMTIVGISAFSALMEERAGLGKTVTMPSGAEPNTSASKYKFSDVEGVDEAKQELMEVVEYLRDPQKFTRLGGKLPKGILLTGPPGTGKTLLAKTIAGEAGVPFFYCSGSEFDEMFVGVGARRVRELFASARRNSPCIIFIDEIDAVGSSRNPKDFQMVKMTLNQLLVEMDGFASTEGVIVIGATNFPDLLDKALVRPGRFDRHISVPLPDVRGRERILGLHAKNVPMAADVSFSVLARGTPGFSGADLANMVNQAAVKASMDGLARVGMKQFEYAKDKIIMGAERTSAVIEEQNRRIIAFHEGGHALVAMLTPGAMPVHKATIMPRGSALGMVSQLPEKDELSWTRQQLVARMDVAFGGRAAEELMFGNDQITSGASSDIEAATRVATAMVTRYGMSPKVGPVLYKEEDFANLSPGTRDDIDKEIKLLLQEARQRATTILKTHKEELHKIAQALLEFETLTRDEIDMVLKGKPIVREKEQPVAVTATPSAPTKEVPNTPVPVPVPVHV